MNVGILQVELLISDGNSLKDKRRVLNRIKDRVKKNINASIAEIGYMDKWRRALLGVAVISNGRKNLSSHLDNIMNFISGDRKVTVIDYTMEMI